MRKYIPKPGVPKPTPSTGNSDTVKRAAPIRKHTVPVKPDTKLPPVRRQDSVGGPGGPKKSLGPLTLRGKSIGQAKKKPVKARGAR